VVAGLVGCGASSSAATVDPHPAASPAARVAHLASERRIAHDALLRRSDFPAGWAQTGQPHPTARSACTAGADARALASARMLSPEFTLSRTSIETADNAVFLDPTTTDAQRSFAELTTRRTLACLGRLVRRSVIASTRGQGAKVNVGRAEIGSLTIAPIGDQSSASRLIIKVSTLGISLTADADVIFVRVGRGVEIFTFARIGSPFDRALEPQLMTPVVGRLSTDLGHTS
jgi:hypothetical protein